MKKTKPTSKSTTKAEARSRAKPLKASAPDGQGRWADDRVEAGDRQPVLRFTPTAWAKLQFFCHWGETEIGGFGITSASDFLLVEEFLTVKQRDSEVTVSFDDEAVADFFEDQVDLGRRPEEFARIWLHTHPGSSASPSSTDEATFHRVFGSCEWAVMFILARGGETYARLRFNVGPGGHLLLPVKVDYTAEFAASNHKAWEEEYRANIQVEDFASGFRGAGSRGDLDWEFPWWNRALPGKEGSWALEGRGGPFDDQDGKDISKIKEDFDD